MSIQNNELMTTATRSNFLLPQAVETTFTAEELAEDMDGIQLNFQQVKVPAGGALQYEIPTEDPDNPDYSRYLEGVILFHHPSTIRTTAGIWRGSSSSTTPPTPTGRKRRMVRMTIR